MPLGLPLLWTGSPPSLANSCAELQIIFFMEILMGVGLGISPLQMAVANLLGSLTGGCLGLGVTYLIYLLNGQSFHNSATKAVLMVLLSGECMVCAPLVSSYWLLVASSLTSRLCPCRSYNPVSNHCPSIPPPSAHDFFHACLHGVWCADSLLVSIHDWSVQLHSLLVDVLCYCRRCRLLLPYPSTAHNGRSAGGDVLWDRWFLEIL